MAIRRKKIFPEDKLISLIRERHPLGAEALYDMYSSSLYGLIVRIVPETAISEDILQETFIRVWSAFEGYDASKGRIYTWMVNIARNLAIDRVRSRTYRNSLLNHELDGYEEFFIQPESASEKADMAFIKKIATTLPNTEREIVDLIYYKGYTHAEVAEQLKIPLGTAKTRLLRAIKRLRTILHVQSLPLAS
ncbi:RNA polymerase sigma factor [Mucilaginibacter kameinonensis]|uniref:RNA polymerase sigma factor n=1 Tax=Mucilaginibacter kameinonensis TaxID=452286 RepID=UPI000EF76F04|nr:sigma-70 family RNA polymerase sigma factor [Mucilaginibacter kameinonensis]